MKLQKLSVRELLTLGFVVILGFNLFSIGIGLANFNNFRTTSQVTSKEASQIRELSLEVQTEFLLARQDEASFLANWRNLGFTNAKAEYGESIQKHLNIARNHLDELTALSSNSQNENFRDIADITARLYPLLDDYEKSFNVTLEKIQERSGADGLEKSLTSSVETMQNQVRSLENQQYFNELLQIQKSEQGYFSIYNQEYVDYVRINTGKLMDEIQSAPAGDLGNINIEKFTAQILEHYDTFTKIVALDQDITKNTTILRDITIDINTITETIGQTSASGLNLANKNLDLAYRITLLVQIAAGSISLLLIIGVFIVLTRQTLRPLNQLTLASERLGRGDFAESLDVQGLREFATLSNTFNSMSAQLRDLIDSLEQRVAERTRDLQMATDVSRQITRELDLEKLLPSLVKQTKEGFELYYTSVFLYDPKTEELLLEAGTGEEGRQMKLEAKSFHINARPSLVAQVARTRKAEIINDTVQSPDHFVNLHLPKTKAEAALPMVVGDDLVGVLDLQSDTAGRFQESDILIFSSLAEQIAIAVRNAQLYQEQEKLAQELTRADLMKSQFLSSMSHELRTPMNAIINLVDMVASEMIGPVNEEQKALLTQSLHSSRHLLHLINDVLDISKIQAGQLTLYLENDVDIYQELDAVIKISSPLVKEPIQFIKDIDSNIPRIEADRRRLRQILLNLLSNAAKFTEEGTITLSIKKRADHLLFAVIDTGPGIPERSQEQIFEPFIQTDDGRKKIEGTGLGLPISRNLVEAHGGKLWVESHPGEGAAFYFTIPYSHPETTK